MSSTQALLSGQPQPRLEGKSFFDVSITLIFYDYDYAIFGIIFMETVEYVAKWKNVNLHILEQTLLYKYVSSVD